MSLIADHFDICDRCDRYVITGTHRYAMRNSPHLCRCEELEHAISEAQPAIAPVRRKLSITTKARAA